MMDHATRQLWQVQADRYQQRFGVYRRMGGKGNGEMCFVEAWKPKTKYVEVVSPRRSK